MTREELAARVAERALLHGDFVLRSGKRSSVYLDKYRFETDPALLGPIGAALGELARRATRGPDRLAGPELGAVPLAAAAALALRHPVPDRPQGHEGLRHARAASRASSRPASACS